MEAGQPSRTALGTARMRAVHQLIENGSIFSDPMAVRILGVDAESLLADAEANQAKRGLRLFMAVRARFAEDELAKSVAQGLRQMVVLGAGLDTFAYRHPYGDRLRVFEVDHPVTQAWKRECLDKVSIPLPATLSFAQVDFERETLADGLRAAGFDPSVPAFFSWLGVVPYLTEAAIFTTLGFIAGLPQGTTVVFDYANPAESIGDQGARAAHEDLARRVAALGETLTTSFDTGKLHRKLAELSFSTIEDLGPLDIASRYFGGRGNRTSNNGGHVLSATNR